MKNKKSAEPGTEKNTASEFDEKVNKKPKKKGRFTTVLLVAVFLLGVCILLYPTVSNWWNSFHQSRAISNYAEAVSSLSDEDCEKYLGEAREYNSKHAEKKNTFVSTAEEKEEYRRILDIEGNGIIGYIEIDKIKISLPIYHGTADSVLQIATGHLEWSSFPVGGKSTHAVLSGHRGLPSAKLFTDLDELAVGDTFVIRVLNEVLTYEVDQILIVLPEETSALEIVEGQDYVTLVTCTPYGINTHRLLVRGHRIDTKKENGDIKVTNDATRIDPMIIVPIIAAPVLILMLIIVLAGDKRRRNNKKREKMIKDINIELDDE